MKIKLAGGCIAATLVAAAAVAPSAVASTVPSTPCTGVISGQTVTAPVVVPAGADCTIIDSTLKRGITAEAGASSLTVERTRVLGHVQAPSVPVFQLIDARIGGRITQGGGSLVVVCGTKVLGAASFSGNSSLMIGSPVFGDVCGANVFAGRLSLADNSGQNELDRTSVLGALTITNNGGPVVRTNVEVTGVLDCEGNAVAPIDGGGNSATIARGQCAPAAV